MCVKIHIYTSGTCICTYMHMYMYVCMYLHTYKFTYIYMYICEFLIFFLQCLSPYGSYAHLSRNLHLPSFLTTVLCAHDRHSIFQWHSSGSLIIGEGTHLTLGLLATFSLHFDHEWPLLTPHSICFLQLNKVSGQRRMDVGSEFGCGAWNQIEIHEWKRRCWSWGGNGHVRPRSRREVVKCGWRTKELRVMGRSKIRKSEFD